MMGTSIASAENESTVHLTEKWDGRYGNFYAISSTNQSSKVDWEISVLKMFCQVIL